MEADLRHIPLIHTKLHRPAVGIFHVTRPKLLDRLNKEVQRPLTLVSAPAGYGKSTLVSSWLDSSDLQSAWLSLDENDNDLHLFLSYFLAAVRTAFPEAGKDIDSVLQSKELPDLQVLAGILINDLDKIDETFVLSLDDYHVIHNKVIHELLEEILKHPPHAMHLVLVSRIDPPLPLAKLRARGQLTEVRLNGLRFSREETTEYLQEMLDTTIDQKVATKFQENTEGWITGLHLVALSLRDKEDFGSLVTDLPESNSMVMEYLVEEILSRQPPLVNEWLIKTSILGRICGELCDAICTAGANSSHGEMSGQEFLQLLGKANLFLIPLDDEHTWFRYHPLFLDMLRRNLKSRYQPAEIGQLHENASAWFSDRKYLDEAFDQATESGNMDAAARLVSRHRHDIMNSGEWRRLVRWLGKLPPDLVERSPDILIMKALYCENRMEMEEARAYTNQVESLFLTESQADTEEWRSLRAEFYTLKALSSYMDGDGKSAISFASRSLKDLSSAALQPRVLSIAILCLARQMTGDLNGAYNAVHDALKAEVSIGTTYHYKLYLILSMAHWMAADMTGMRQAASQLLKIFQEYGLPESRSIAHYFLGVFHYLRDEKEKAEEYLSALVKDFYEPNYFVYVHGAFALSLSQLAQGRDEEARGIAELVIKKSMETRSSESLLTAEAFRSEISLRQGHIAQAQKWANSFDPHPFSPGYRFYGPQLTFVKVLLATNTTESLQQAEGLLTELHDYYCSIHNVAYLIDVLLLQALLSDTLGKETRGLEKLSEALTLAEPGEVIRPFLDLGPRMSDLLNRLIVKDADLKYAGQILTAFGVEETEVIQEAPGEQAAHQSAANSQALVEPLTNREREILSILSERLSNDEISERLFISPETVKRHLYNIYQKLDVKSRQQAIARAGSLGIT